MSALVDEHLVRLAEDGRAARTLDTYRFAAAKLQKFIGGVRVGEATPARIDAALRSMRAAHGPTMARQSKTILRGALQLAVMANVLGSNPVRDVQTIKSKGRPNGATALTAERLRVLLARLRVSERCRDYDLIDPITMLIATGLRESELLGLLWSDFNLDASTLTVTGRVVRSAGQGLQRHDDAKSDAGLRTIPLPRFAVDVLTERRRLPYLGEQTVIFPVNGGNPTRPEQFQQAMAPGPRPARSGRRDHAQLPQVTRDPDRRRGVVGPYRRRPPGPHQRLDDARQVHEPGPSSHPGGRPAGPKHRYKR